MATRDGRKGEGQKLGGRAPRVGVADCGHRGSRLWPPVPCTWQKVSWCPGDKVLWEEVSPETLHPRDPDGLMRDTARSLWSP